MVGGDMAANTFHDSRTQGPANSGDLHAPERALAVDIPKLFPQIQKGAEQIARAGQALAESDHSIRETLKTVHAALDLVRQSFREGSKSALDHLHLQRFEQAGPDAVKAAAESHLKTGDDFRTLAALAFLGATTAIQNSLLSHAKLADKIGQNLEPNDSTPNATQRVSRIIDGHNEKFQKIAKDLLGLDASGALAKDHDSAFYFVGENALQLEEQASSLLRPLIEFSNQAIDLSRLVSSGCLGRVASNILPPSSSSQSRDPQDAVHELLQDRAVISDGNAANLLITLRGLLDSLRTVETMGLNTENAQLLTLHALAVHEKTMNRTGDTGFAREILSAGPKSGTPYFRACESLGAFGWKTTRLHDLSNLAPDGHQDPDQGALLSERTLCVKLLGDQLVATRGNLKVRDSNHSPMNALTSFGIQGYGPILDFAERLAQTPNLDREQHREDTVFLRDALEQVRFMADVRRPGDSLYLNHREGDAAKDALRHRIEKLCLSIASPESSYGDLRHEAMWTVAWLGTGSDQAKGMFRTLLENKEAVRDVVKHAAEYRTSIGLNDSDIETARTLAAAR